LKVSIIPRSVEALGDTIQWPTEDRFLPVERDLKSRITVLMGGRAAEGLIFAGSVSTGAADDLQRATEIALEMARRHSMAETVSQRSYTRLPHTFLPVVPADCIQAAEASAREMVLTRETLTADNLPAIRPQQCDERVLPLRPRRIAVSCSSVHDSDRRWMRQIVRP
jgi:cell division protease FtsH